MDIQKTVGILLGFILTGCGAASPPYVDPLLLPFTKSFAKEALRFSGRSYSDTPTTTVFEELPKGIAGQCDHRDGHIAINKTYFQKIPYYLRELLVFHELGHCILNRRHSDRPGAIMYFRLTDPTIYAINKEKELKILFVGE